DGGVEAGRREGRRDPGCSAVLGANAVQAGKLRLLVVAPGRKAAARVEERDREESGGRIAVGRGSVANGPRPSTVRGVEDACDLRAARDEPRVLAALQREEARTAGREGALVLESRGHDHSVFHRPGCPAVARRADAELTVDGVAEDEALAVVPEGDRV